MAYLEQLNAKVAASIANQDGSWEKRREMLDAIEELRILAMGPGEYITRLRYQPLQNMSVVMALEMGLVQAIVQNGGHSITAWELAAMAGQEKLLVVRLMRMLTALHITTEVSPETYASDANAEFLAHPSRIGAMKFINNPTLKVMASAIPYMRLNDGKFPQFPDKDRGEISLEHFAHGMSLWEYLQVEPEHLANFSAYLSGRRADMVERCFDIWPAKERITQIMKSSPDREGVLVVDVGGNVGYDLQAFRKRFPEFKGEGRLVLQDLPDNIRNAKTLLAGDDIEAMEYDFFTPQSVRGAHIYYFGGIYHDWPDDEALRILQNTVEAMAPDSRIIIDEYALPDEKAPLKLVTYDILMMTNVSGIERSLGHYRVLVDKAGLELVNVWRTSVDSVLEVKLKQ